MTLFDIIAWFLIGLGAVALARDVSAERKRRLFRRSRPSNTFIGLKSSS